MAIKRLFWGYGTNRDIHLLRGTTSRDLTASRLNVADETGSAPGFHPAGACIMRNEHDGHTEFCAVCRDILVDCVDPSRHAEIDRDHAEIDPQE